MPNKVAILLDGGFVKKRIQNKSQRFPTVSDILGVVQNIMDQTRLRGSELFRVYYYDAPPIGVSSVRNSPVEKE